MGGGGLVSCIAVAGSYPVHVASVSFHTKFCWNMTDFVTGKWALVSNMVIGFEGKKVTGDEL